MRAASHEFALRQPTAQQSFVSVAPPRSSFAIALWLAAFQPGASLGQISYFSSARLFCVRRTPRDCHGACDHLRPGRLRASHAVCLRGSTLEPAICARKEEADLEYLSTTGRVLAESSVMQGDFFDTQTVSFGFYVTSRHCIPRLSPRNSNLNDATANNGAAPNRGPGGSGRLRGSRSTGSVTPPASAAASPAARAGVAPSPSAALLRGRASRPTVGELESLAVLMRTV